MDFRKDRRNNPENGSKSVGERQGVVAVARCTAPHLTKNGEILNFCNRFCFEPLGHSDAFRLPFLGSIHCLGQEAFEPVHRTLQARSSYTYAARFCRIVSIQVSPRRDGPIFLEATCLATILLVASRDPLCYAQTPMDFSPRPPAFSFDLHSMRSQRL